MKIMSEQEWTTEFKHRLRERMEYLEITQKELSKRSGVSQSLISGYLAGKTVPSAYHISLLAKALITTSDKLIDF